jgi:hypothetical protein
VDVKEHLDRLTPETQRLPDWDGVLRDSRPSRARWAVPRLAIVAAALGLATLLAVGPWRSGERAGVVDRALAAIGDGPVTHLVLREDQGGTLIDLETGERRPLYHERELWIDADRGFVSVARFGGAVNDIHAASPAEIERLFAVFATGYREALETGRARLAGSGVVDGMPVFWIKVQRDVDKRTGEEWALEVAVAQDSYHPVYIRSTRDGKPERGSGSRVLRAEHLPADSFAVAPRPREPTASFFGVSPEPIRLAEARAILGDRGAWLGESFRGLRLTTIRKLTMGSGYSRETGKWADELTGVRLVYGTSTTEGVPEGSGRSITLEQAPRSHSAIQRGIGNYRVPDGHVLMTGPGAVYLSYEGTRIAIRILGGSVDEAPALAAARALRPMTPR